MVLWLGDLVRAWKGQGILAETLGEFRRMLEDAKWMFKVTMDYHLDPTEHPELGDTIYDKDIEVNKLERRIRKMIVQHLAFQPGKDANYCLILMSVVKDAERLGDYCKNLYQVSEFLQKPIDRALFARYFDELDKDILDLFGQTKDAFIGADEEKAKSTWDYHGRINKLCDKIVEELVQSDLKVDEGKVAFQHKLAKEPPKISLNSFPAY